MKIGVELRETAMRTAAKALLVVGCVSLLPGVIEHGSAAEAKSIAMKAGETTELESVYWVSNCRSLLRGTPKAEILEGPPDMSVSIKEQKVTPRSYNCAKPVEGGVLELTAPKEIKARAEARLTIRIDYPTLDGLRQTSKGFDLTLVP